MPVRLVSLSILYVFASENNWMNDDVKTYSNQKSDGAGISNHWEIKEN